MFSPSACTRGCAPAPPVPITRARGALPMIPGIDAVGRRPDGKRIYFVADDARLGHDGRQGPRRSAARDRSPRRRRCRNGRRHDEPSHVRLGGPAPPRPDPTRPERPRTRSHRQRRNDGRPGRQAGSVPDAWSAPAATSSGLAHSPSSAPTAVVQLTDDAEARAMRSPTAAAEVDIVIDYLWGKPAQQAMMALLTARSDRSRVLSWIQIGAIAGPDDRAALGRPALRKPPPPRQRPRSRLDPGVPRRTALPRRSDPRGCARAKGKPEGARGRQNNLGRHRRARRAHRAHTLSAMPA